MGRAVFILSLSLWLILNGRADVQTVIVGVPVALVVTSLWGRLRPSGPDATLAARGWRGMVRLISREILYAGLLVRQIVKANLAVVRMIWAPEIEVEPCLVRLRTRLRTKAARVALADSITLTPGTVTVSLDGDELIVHALDRDMAHGLIGSAFERELLRLEDLEEVSHA